MLNSANTWYILIIVAVIGYFVWSNYSSKKEKVETPNYHWEKTKDGVYVLHDKFDKAHYNEKSLKETYENIKRNRHEYETEQAYHQRLEMFQTGLNMINDSNTQKESSNSDSETL